MLWLQRLSCVVSVLLLPVLAVAQESTATIRGIVLDPARTPVAGARVEAVEVGVDHLGHGLLAEGLLLPEQGGGLGQEVGGEVSHGGLGPKGKRHLAGTSGGPATGQYVTHVAKSGSGLWHGSAMGQGRRMRWWIVSA